MTQLSTIETINIAETMARYGWDSIWDLSPLDTSGPIAVREGRAKPKVGIGVWTGPQGDLLCLKSCVTNAEADLWLSPMRETHEQALKASVMQYTKLKRLMPKTACEWEIKMNLRLL